MAIESVATASAAADPLVGMATRLNEHSALLDGVTSVLEGFVESSDLTVARQAYVLSATLDRVGHEISQFAADLGRQGAQVGEPQGRQLAGAF